MGVTIGQTRSHSYCNPAITRCPSLGSRLPGGRGLRRPLPRPLPALGALRRLPPPPRRAGGGVRPPRRSWPPVSFQLPPPRSGAPAPPFAPRSRRLPYPGPRSQFPLPKASPRPGAGTAARSPGTPWATSEGADAHRRWAVAQRRSLAVPLPLPGREQDADRRRADPARLPKRNPCTGGGAAPSLPPRFSRAPPLALALLTAPSAEKSRHALAGGAGDRPPPVST